MLQKNSQYRRSPLATSLQDIPMPDPLNPVLHRPSELHRAILAGCQGELSRLLAALPAPQPMPGNCSLSLTLPAAQAGPAQNDGRVALICHCTLMLRIEAGGQHSQAGLDLAAGLASYLQPQRWGWRGTAVGLPDNLKLQRYASPGPPSQEIWQLDWQQQIIPGPVQADPIAPEPWLAINPANPDDLNEYHQVSEPCLNSSTSGSAS